MNKFFQRQINKFEFRKDVRNIVSRDFTIISSNCIGGLIYRTLGVAYNTPTVGLFFHAPCYVRFLADLNVYLSMTPRLTNRSRYVDHVDYPIGILDDDVEIHFLHYASGADAVDKWLRRRDRVNLDKLFVSMTDRDGFDMEYGSMFDSLPFDNKVLFSAQPLDLASCITIRAYEGGASIGNIYTDYNNFVGDFSFSRWIDGASKKRVCI